MELSLLVLTISGCVASVVSVIAAWSASRSAKKLRSTISMQGELHEMRDYLAKLDAWAKRINSRETMKARRAAEREESSTPVSSVSDKDELRRRAGLRAGEPARHREAS
ncbi:MAG TPA: hypothetical protein VGK73_17100 [Polyangiaceae bacterium]